MNKSNFSNDLDDIFNSSFNPVHISLRPISFSMLKKILLLVLILVCLDVYGLIFLVEGLKVSVLLNSLLILDFLEFLYCSGRNAVLGCGLLFWGLSTLKQVLPYNDLYIKSLK